MVRLVALVDDMVLVDDRDLLEAMQLSAQALGLLLEPSRRRRPCGHPGSRSAGRSAGDRSEPAATYDPEHLRGLTL